MRTGLGLVACLLYVWRVYDPRGSYAAFFDVASWLTGWLLAGDGVSAALRNLVSLVLLDQVEGFLLGIVFLSVVAAPVWVVRRSVGWCWRRLRRRAVAAEPLTHPRPAATHPADAEEPLTLVALAPAPRSPPEAKPKC